MFTNQSQNVIANVMLSVSWPPSDSDPARFLSLDPMLFLSII